MSHARWKFQADKLYTQALKKIYTKREGRILKSECPGFGSPEGEMILHSLPDACIKP